MDDNETQDVEMRRQFMYKIVELEADYCQVMELLIPGDMFLLVCALNVLSKNGGLRKCIFDAVISFCYFQFYVDNIPPSDLDVYMNGNF